MNAVRKQVEEQIIEVIREAEEQGFDGVTAAMRTFPGIPETVVWGAWSVLESRKVEGWWQQVERTIDGEIIRRALSSPAGAQP
jgi:hypothetical protein